jgi:hypothetical protein
MFSTNASQVSTAANYIEDVFSTYLYTGTSATQTITNGINLSTNGGLVWIKNRTNAGAVSDHVLLDTVRGPSSALSSNLTSAAVTGYLSSFDSSGFTLLSTGGAKYNYSTAPYVSWTFRKQAKFFDVVTYTGNGTSGRTVSHNLGSEPGCIIIKNTSNGTVNWAVYHRSVGNTGALYLNASNATDVWSAYWNNTTPSSTNFTLGNSTETNANSATYVAYLFAHNAGGFGLTGNDNVISCGSFTTDGSGNATVNLGYEPQWVLVKSSSNTSNWAIIDNMRGWTASGGYLELDANLSDPENNYLTYSYFPLNATGFNPNLTSSNANKTFIYIAIRRGPMKVPTSGTSVFGLNARTGTGANATVTGSAGVSDAVFIKNRGAAVLSLFSSRLTGTGYLVTSSTQAEIAANANILQANPWDVMDGVKVGNISNITNASGNTFINYLFDRAPGFFDVVCYTSGSSDTIFNHNLGVTPELILLKTRSNVNDWYVYSKSLTNPSNYYLMLDSTAAQTDVGGTQWTVSSTQVTVAPYITSNGWTNVAYLFASCPGVSKVGSYTGTGATQTIDCGFTGGARFVLIKRTDSTGAWYVWDTARGMVSGTDPSLLLNSSAAEVNANSIYTTGVGFQIVSTAVQINASGGSYIFLAIA